MQPLVQGEVAPFSGQLLSTKRVKVHAEALLKAEDFDRRLKVETNRIQKLADIDVNLEKRYREIDKESFQKSLDLLKERLKEAKEESEVPFWERPAFVIPITAVLTGAVFYAAFELARR